VCRSLKVLWWGLVATTWIKTYCCFMENGVKFCTDAVQKGGGSSSWKHFGEFLCRDIKDSVFLHKRISGCSSYKLH